MCRSILPVPAAKMYNCVIVFRYSNHQTKVGGRIFRSKLVKFSCLQQIFGKKSLPSYFFHTKNFVGSFENTFNYFGSLGSEIQDKRFLDLKYFSLNSILTSEIFTIIIFTTFETYFSAFQELNLSQPLEIYFSFSEHILGSQIISQPLRTFLSLSQLLKAFF